MECDEYFIIGIMLFTGCINGIAVLGGRKFGIATLVIGFQLDVRQSQIGHCLVALLTVHQIQCLNFRAVVGHMQWRIECLDGVV